MSHQSQHCLIHGCKPRCSSRSLGTRRNPPCFFSKIGVLHRHAPGFPQGRQAKQAPVVRSPRPRRSMTALPGAHNRLLSAFSGSRPAGSNAYEHLQSCPVPNRGTVCPGMGRGSGQSLLPGGPAVRGYPVWLGSVLPLAPRTAAEQAALAERGQALRADRIRCPGDDPVDQWLRLPAWWQDVNAWAQQHLAGPDWW